MLFIFLAIFILCFGYTGLISYGQHLINTGHDENSGFLGWLMKHSNLRKSISSSITRTEHKWRDPEGQWHQNTEYLYRDRDNVLHLVWPDENDEYNQILMEPDGLLTNIGHSKKVTKDAEKRTYERLLSDDPEFALKERTRRDIVEFAQDCLDNPDKECPIELQKDIANAHEQGYTEMSAYFVDTWHKVMDKFVLHIK